MPFSKAKYCVFCLITRQLRQISLLLLAAFLFMQTPAAADTLVFQIQWSNSKIQLSTVAELELPWFDDAFSFPASGSIPWIMLSAFDCSGKSVEQLELIDIQTDTIQLPQLWSNDIQQDFDWRNWQADEKGSCRNFLLLMPVKYLDEGRVVRLLSAKAITKKSATRQLFAGETPIYAENSVLSTGKWVKLGVVSDGVYRIRRSEMEQMGWNVSEIDPRKIAIYGNGGRMLPERNSDFRFDDLYENAIVVTGENDAVFDAEDVVYFYGQGPVRWNYSNLTGRFTHQANYYTDTTYYFLTVKAAVFGRRMVDHPQLPQGDDRDVHTYLDRVCYEQDLVSLIHSGKEWFGEELTRNQSSFTKNFNFSNRVPSRPIHLNMHFAGRSITENVFFNLQANGQTLINDVLLMRLSTNDAVYARDSYQSTLISDTTEQIEIKVNFVAGTDNSKGWLNYLRLNVWRKLNYENKPLSFRNPETVGPGRVSDFKIENATSNLWLWDVTHPLRPRKVQPIIANSELHFTVVTDSLREFLLFDPQHAMQVPSKVAQPNQNLHATPSTDMLIVAHPDFLGPAQELAQIHLDDDGLQSLVVNIKEVYNEFGSGAPDPTALRDFVRMVYLRSNQQLKYLLLFGDASYDYKDRVSNNSNFIPTYQATNSLVETQSFVSDDYFGLLGPSEGHEMEGLLDIGIGRFPVRNAAEAQTMVNKTRHYLDHQREQTGEWRNSITFVADDGDSNLHLSQAETLSVQVEVESPQFNIQKIYLDAYRRESVPGGWRYPDASNALLQKINEGSLIVNYTGHGGINGLSDERVFTITEIEGLKNFDRMPFFITATCEFSRFDNPSFVSAGERLLLNPQGGAIALMTTTRLAFAHSNFALNRRVYYSMFNDEKTEIRRLGDIIRLSKNPTSSFVFNFVLLGNPALRLRYPESKIELTKFNHHSLPAPFDTLRAMTQVTVEGVVKGRDGQMLDNFNGYVFPKMFDKKTSYRTLANDGQSFPANFTQYETLLQKGRASVINGKFELSFLLPRNIAYQFGRGRISFYAVDTSNWKDAGGFYDRLIVGGTDHTVTIDKQGPSIQMYAESPLFNNGDYLISDPVIYIRIEDPQGVHFLGNTIGRDIVLTHNAETTSKYVVNQLYVPELNNFAAGNIVFPLRSLSHGRHEITLKAWDLHNNSSEATIWFMVDPEVGIQLVNVKNQPNPFNNETFFVFEHNKPGEKLKVTIDIYHHTGHWVSTIEQTIAETSGQHEQIRWNPAQSVAGRLPSGLYLCRIKVEAQDGQSEIRHHKMLYIKN
jgi:hypothetical protein